MRSVSQSTNVALRPPTTRDPARNSPTWGEDVLPARPLLLLTGDMSSARQSTSGQSSEPGRPSRSDQPPRSSRSPTSSSHRSSPGIELCYQTFGDPDDDPLLLVMGLGGPMTWWDTDLCERLARAGFFVIRYDNRDTGRSTRSAPGSRRAQLVRAFAGRARAGAVLARRHGRRRPRPPGPPRHRGRARRRGLDGRHDRPDHGHARARAGAVADQHHVHDRTPHGRLAEPVPAADADRAAQARARGLRAGERRDVEGDRLPRLPLRRRDPARVAPRRPSTAASRPAA